MRIDFPDHPISEWRRRPWWLFWKPIYRRKHWRWTVDHIGCEFSYYWEYGWWGELSVDLGHQIGWAVGDHTMIFEAKAISADS